MANYNEGCGQGPSAGHVWLAAAMAENVGEVLASRALFVNRLLWMRILQTILLIFDMHIL